MLFPNTFRKMFWFVMYMLLCLVILNGSVYCSRYKQSAQGSWFRFFFFFWCVMWSCLVSQLDLSTVGYTYYTLWILKSVFSIYLFLFLCALVCINVSVKLTPCIIWSFGVLLESTSVLFWKPSNNIWIRMHKIQFCENHTSVFWFTLVDIANDIKMKVLNNINSVCLIS